MALATNDEARHRICGTGLRKVARE